ncbi:maleylpyruvate isomerase family mycothiol-dependent enzyme [Saccharopolyspora griseoalba]|uniref:Maleylpyruvate isomerase family mycothiol-dependent enzyme n=1 Tax=Saccharopolyspora griseoalba TaxID=1431848 RepID=A0ABW2LIB0_9PSEU
MDLHAELRARLDAFHDLLDADLTAPVAACPGWTLHELADHLGNENMWVTTAVREGHPNHERSPAPREGLAEWFASTSASVLDALAADRDAPAWTFSPSRTVGFWLRRRTQETMVHLWDAENALGETTPLDVELAADGVAEVFDTFAPRQIDLGRISRPGAAFRLRASDSGHTWSWGPGEPVAEITGPVADLLLLLWKRIPAEHPTLTWTGDRSRGEALLGAALVP